MPITPGSVAGGVALGTALLNKKKNVSLPSLDPQMRAIDAAGQRQRDIAGNLTTSLAPLTTNYGSDVKSAIEARRGEVNAASDKYLSNFSTAADSLAKKSSDMLKQRVLEAQPELQRQLREGLASTGQLGSGAGFDAFTQQAVTAGKEIGQGQSEIELQRLQGLQQATKDVFGVDTNFAMQALGIDENTLNTILQSGREDLIREAQQLIDESRNTTQQKTALLTAGQDRAMATDLGSKTASQDLMNAIIGAAGRVAGGYASRQATA